MKSVTEFFTHKLIKGLDTKKALTGEGKSPEEVLAGLGEAFKLEGDKLKFFNNAMDVASQNMEKLSRILVVTYSEGETIAPKAVKIEEHHYIPEFQTAAGSVAVKPSKGGGGDKKGKKGPKPSPWGISPEEKEAKKNAGKAKAQPKAE